MSVPERLSVILTFEPMTLQISEVPFSPYLVLPYLDLWTSKCNQFIFFSNCNLAVNLVKFPHAVSKTLCSRTDGHVYSLKTECLLQQAKS